jgi:hypothetical protein
MPDTITALGGLPRIVRIRAHEAFLMILCVLAGVGGILDPAANTLNALLPAWFLWIWNVGLIVGALLALAGMWIHSPTGPLIERAALGLLNGISVTYACVVIYATGVRGLEASIAVILFVAFNVLRLFQIRVALAAERALLLTMRQFRDPDDSGSQP